MTPTHAISADEARRLLAEDRAEFVWRLSTTTNVVWKTKEELAQIFQQEFDPKRLPSFRLERWQP